jgi:hypothetical protein
MAVAYRIAPGGGISEHAIPPSGLGIGGATNLLDGPEDEYWHGWTLDQVAEIRARCAPWTTLWCGPRIKHDDDQMCDGRCLPGCQTLAVATRWCAAYTLATTYHECAHALDGYLVPKARATLDAATAAMDWPGEYLASPAERRARFVEHTCMSLDHGVILHITPGSATETAWQMYTGEIARQRAAAIARADAARRSAPPLSRFGPLSRRAA